MTKLYVVIFFHLSCESEIKSNFNLEFLRVLKIPLCGRSEERL